MNTDIWVIITSTNGLQSVSNTAKVKSNKNNYILAQWKDKDGYKICQIKINGKWKHCRVHRLVAQAFIPNPDKKPEVNHINGIKDDNRIQNLEWATTSENQKHAFKIGLSKARRGSDACNSILSEKQTMEIFLSTLPQVDIAKLYNVSKHVINQIKIGKAWEHLTKKEYVRKYPAIGKEILLDIRTSKEKNKVLAEKYGLPYNTIRRIKKGERHARG